MLEKRWKELENNAREELEELLRAEGYDMKDLLVRRGGVSGREQSGKGHKKSKKKARVAEKHTSHPNYMCDHCKNKRCIVGVRYSCKVGAGVVCEAQECEDYDLCEACFAHAAEFHPHRHFLAFDPPQPDVFGILREGKGREAEVKEVKKEEKVKEVEKVEKKDEKKEVEMEMDCENDAYKKKICEWNTKEEAFDAFSARLAARPFDGLEEEEKVALMLEESQLREDMTAAMLALKAELVAHRHVAMRLLQQIGDGVGRLARAVKPTIPYHMEGKKADLPLLLEAVKYLMCCRDLAKETASEEEKEE